MEDRKEKVAPWLSVPQFGDWEQKGGVPDYSVDFSKIRENRKQHKRDLSRASIGNEEELIMASSTTPSTNNTSDNANHQFSPQPSPTTRKSILSYFNCCVKA
ncbi:uncharacterized protein LOC111024373 [Momordica charantia]|uniref:Uncharacterized protein LOC111024373 n=1 Tax=Momordica charantia TaxID=3673 RepID=A0A6J1DU25_MOMCH|nr:uncharacterized protein LOC111024373 [Momordica charantia]